MAALIGFAAAQSALWFPPACVDPPDHFHIDSNEDGIDGMRVGPVFVSALYGDDAAIGDVAHPLKTLEMGLCVAQALGGRPLYADASAVYSTNPLVAFPNTALYGGYAPFAPGSSHWWRSDWTELQPSSPTVLLVPDAGTFLTVEGFIIVGGDGTPGSPPIPAYVVDHSGATVSFADSAIGINPWTGARAVGRSGADGVAGATGATGTPGADGGAGYSATLFVTAYGGGGGAGADGGYLHSGGKGGKGGDCSFVFVGGGLNGYDGSGAGCGRAGLGGDAGNGRTAGDGNPGGSGSRGSAGWNGLASHRVFGGSGGSGTAGSAGSGGGGGGGGGGAAAVIGVISGGGGGGGGAGGAGGAGGSGGEAGQPAIALVWRNTVLGTLDLSGARLYSGIAGAGGTGGSGGNGGEGGAGGTGGAEAWLLSIGSGTGGNGGKGGPGGFGGAGAGGHGGAAFAVAAHSLTSSQLFMDQDTTLIHTGGGSGGAGGRAPNGGYAQNGDQGASSTLCVDASLPEIGKVGSASPYIASAARAIVAAGPAPTVTIDPAIMTSTGSSSGFTLANTQTHDTPKGMIRYDGVRLRYEGRVPYAAYSDSFDYTVTDSRGVQHHAYGIVSVVRSARAVVRLGDWVGERLSGEVAIGIANRSDVALRGPAAFEGGVSSPFLLPPGNSVLRIKHGHWLSGTASPVDQGDGTDLYTFDLVNGDVDGDDAVTVYDYNALSDAFDTSDGDAAWNPNADLDGDGAVTVYDYNILSSNFDRAGE